MSEIALESFSRPLVLVHAFAAIVLVGALTHGAAFIRLSKQKGRAGNLKRSEKFWPIAWIALPITFVSGLLAYPTYRIRTRAEFLDEHFPLVAGLFDVKENYAAIVLALLAACWLLRREPAESEARTLLHDGFYFAATALSWIALVLGVWVVLHRGMA